MAFDEGGGDAGGADDLLGGGAAGGGEAAASAEGGQGGEGGAAGGEGGTGGEGGAEPDWVEKLSAEAGEGESASNRDWAKAAGLRDIDQLVKVARDNQRAARDKAGVKLPGADAKPEEVAAFRAAIGVPEKPEGYEIKAPEGEGKLNEPLIAALRESAIRHGAPKGAFEGLVGDFIQAQLDEAAAEKTRLDGEAAAKVKEWGGQKDTNLAHINTAARALGLSREDMTWFRTMPGGAGRALDLVAKLGAGMAEDVLQGGGKGRFGVSGAEAKAELDRLKADPEFAKKVMVAGSPERARYDRLNTAAAEYQAAQQSD